jgi:hypothetical protein
MGTIKAIIGFAAIIAVIIVGFAVLPAYFTNYQFEDTLNNEALAATYSTKTDEDIRNNVFKKAQEMEIPITREQIRVQRTGSQGVGTLAIAADYTVRVNLPGYPLDLNFRAETKNKGVW